MLVPSNLQLYTSAAATGGPRLKLKNIFLPYRAVNHSQIESKVNLRPAINWVWVPTERSGCLKVYDST